MVFQRRYVILYFFPLLLMHCNRIWQNPTPQRLDVELAVPLNSGGRGSRAVRSLFDNSEKASFRPDGRNIGSFLACFNMFAVFFFTWTLRAVVAGPRQDCGHFPWRCRINGIGLPRDA